MDNDTQGNDYALKFLADMEAKYAALGNAIASVRAALNIGALGGLGTSPELATQPTSASATGAALPRGAFLGKSIAEAIKIYLNAVRTRKNNKDIAQALKDGGAVSTGKFDNRINGALFQLKKIGEVLRFEDGWGLAEWYPESFRTRVAEKTARATSGKRKSNKKSTQKAKPTKDLQTKPPGLQQRIETLLRSQPTRVFPAQEIAQSLNVNLGAVNLTLGKMTSKGKIGKWQGGYQAPEDNWGCPRAETNR